MNQLIEQLLKDIQSMIGHHRQLIGLAEKQRQALISGDTEALQELLPKFESHTSAILETEHHRIEVTNTLATQLGLDGQSVTVTLLVGKLDNVSGERLERSSDQLKQVVSELAVANERNAMLTKFSTDYTQKVLEMVVGVGRNENYGPSKKPQQGQSRIINLQA